MDIIDYYSDDSFNEIPHDETSDDDSMKEFIVRDVPDVTEESHEWRDGDDEMDGIYQAAIIDRGRETNDSVRMVLRSHSHLKEPPRYMDRDYEEMMMDDADYSDVMAPLHGDDGVIDSDQEETEDTFSCSSDE